MIRRVSDQASPAAGPKASSQSAWRPIDGSGRLLRLQQWIGTDRCDDAAVAALLVTDLVNVRYLTGFTGSNAALLVPVVGVPLLFTDSRYEERAADELAAHGARVELRISKTGKAQIAAIKGRLRGQPLGLESSHVSWAAAEAWKADGLDVKPVVSAVERLRRTKDEGEIDRLTKACAIADEALGEVLGLLRSGPTEGEFAKELERAMERRGSEAPSFATIVASGSNASRPHHATGDRRIGPGDQVIIDFGATVDGYHSDMTRTVHVGEPTKAQRRHFQVVRQAQAAGVAAVKAGVPIKQVDRACREVIAAAGWADHFSHGTGHGIGLVIHESPWIGSRVKGRLAIGDVVTVEPGVYLPGKGGVRVEDSVLVTATGNVPLTLAPKELVV